MLAGAHVSTAGGIDKAIDRALEIEAEAMQIFASPPQGWAFKPVSDDSASLCREKAQASNFGPVFLHGVYLVNLGTENPDNLQKGIDSLVNYMKSASSIGAMGVIFHPGSHKGRGFEGVLKQTVESIQQVLSAAPDNDWLILENMAGMGDHIGAKFQELGGLIQSVGDPRLKVCLDTQHCFAAGYEITTKDGIQNAMEEFNKEIGLSKLVVVHANDSKTPFASGVDRHENIGQGYMGLEGFETIIHHQAFRDLPFLLEVPGIEKKGPDRENVEILKRLRGNDNT